MVNKKLVCSAVVGVLLVLLIGNLVLANTTIKLFINGAEVSCSPAPVIVNDRVMVPLAFVSKELGAKVQWDEYNQAVRISTEKKLPRLKINGELTTWPYWIKDGKLYLERRNAVQLINEALIHPNHSIAYFQGDSSMTINGKKIPLGYTREGEYQIVNVDYLRDLGVVNFAWDAQDENIVILPR
ncbi:MAG: stalk domain-containing protein [Methanobacterium sp.]